MVNVAWADCRVLDPTITSMACQPSKLVKPVPPSVQSVWTVVVPGPKVRWAVSIPPSLRRNLYVPLTPGGAIMWPSKLTRTGQCPVAGLGLAVRVNVIGLLGVTG